MAKRTLVPLLTFVVLGTLVHAAPADSIASFLGKWKLDPAHSRLTDQMKVEAAGLNKFNMNFSGDNVETIVADGTDQPGLFGTTLAVIVQDANNWKVVRKKDGRTTIIGLWQLSPDGKTLTDNFTGYRASQARPPAPKRPASSVRGKAPRKTSTPPMRSTCSPFRTTGSPLSTPAAN